MTTLRVAIIGVGYAASQHYDALNTLDGFIVAGISDPLSDGCQAPDWAPNVPTMGVEDMLADSRIDVVSICTPPGTHAPTAIQALRSGKAVVVEKPAAATCAEFDLLMRERDRRNLPVAVMHQHRFVLPEDSLRAAWSSATASVEVYKHRPVAYFDSAAWRTQPELAGGGSFAHLGIHYADLACQLLGLPVEITGFAMCDFHQHIETRITLSIRFNSGASLALVCNCIPQIRFERLSVNYDGSYLHVENGACRWRLAGGQERLSAEIQKCHLRQQVYEEMALALHSGNSTLPRSDLAHSLGVMKIMGSIQQMVRPQQSSIDVVLPK